MKECLVCGSEIIGRRDKIYCSEKCKSAKQYEQRLEEEGFYFHVDKKLKVNRKLLKKFNHTGFTTVRKDALLSEGFDPKFFTHFWKNSKGQVYLFCYEYGFCEIEKEGKQKYLLVEWQEYMQK